LESLFKLLKLRDTYMAMPNCYSRLINLIFADSHRVKQTLAVAIQVAFIQRMMLRSVDLTRNWLQLNLARASFVVLGCAMVAEQRQLGHIEMIVLFAALLPDAPL
jgi:hypothetical protein